MARVKVPGIGRTAVRHCPDRVIGRLFRAGICLQEAIRLPAVASAKPPQEWVRWLCRKDPDAGVRSMGAALGGVDRVQI